MVIIQTIRNWNKQSFDVKKVTNFKSFKNKLYTNLIVEKIEIENFEHLLNSLVVFCMEFAR